MANRKPNKRDENILPIRDLIFHCLSKWYWFVVTLTISSALAVLYILSTPPVYVRSTEILIKEDIQRKGGSQAFQNFAASQSTANAMEEVKAFQSPGIMTKVIERLNLDIEYYTEGDFFDVLVYSTRPMRIATLDLREGDRATFNATIIGRDSIELNSFRSEESPLSGSIIAVLGDTVATPIGRMVIDSTSYFKEFHQIPIFVKKRNINELANEFCANLTAGLVNEETSIIRLTLKDISTTRATDVLNAITEIYNEKWIEENNQIAIKTSEFIGERAEELKTELLQLDRQIAIFNSENRLSTSATSEMVQSATQNTNSDRLLQLSSQLELATFMKSHLSAEGGKDIIPANSGLNIAGIEGLISEYNTKLLERNRIAANSSETHPIVVDYDTALGEMRTSIYAAIEDYISVLRRDIALIEREDRSDRTRITSNTGYIKELQVLLRQQKVKEALYLFLLQKLEETELSKEFTASNNRMLLPPGGSNTPVEPMQQQAIMLAIVLGLLIPITIIFVRELTNRKVRGRRDIENIDVPFIGEIPYYSTTKGKIVKREQERHEIVVKEGSRDVINEAFRVLRTNLEFMNDKKDGANVIILTSFNPGSGKTYLTMNIAAGLALKGSKVLVIDGDMRHGSASAYIDDVECGLSDYLSGGTEDIEKIIAKETGYKNLNILPIGSTPPNPTELLHSKRFKSLIETMRKNYDYVFIDCPPIDIVADTQIIEEYADRTIFVVRAGLLDRDMLYELEEIYKEKRLKNLSMILNGTYTSQGHYGRRYGYSYSYGYGYGYGYGYLQKESKKKQNRATRP